MRRKWIIIAAIAVFFGGMAGGALIDSIESSTPEVPATSAPAEEFAEVAKLHIPIARPSAGSPDSASSPDNAGSPDSVSSPDSATRPNSSNSPDSANPSDIIASVDIDVPKTLAPANSSVLMQTIAISHTVISNQNRAAKANTWQELVIITALTMVAAALVLFIAHHHFAL